MSWRELAAGTIGAGAATATTLGLVQRYLRQELWPPTLIHGEAQGAQEEEEILVKKVGLLLRDYWPHPIFEFSGYVSSAWSGLWAVLPVPVSPGRVEQLTLSDGGTVSLHWAEAPEHSGPKCIVLVLPGLNNDSRTGFVQNTMQHFRKHGFYAVALNFRGSGGLPLTSPRLGCADSWRDIPEVVEHLEATHAGAALFCIGFSMGAGILLRHLGEKGARARFRAAVCISAPIDFPAAVEYLEGSLKKRVVNFVMVNAVKFLMFRSHWNSPLAQKLSRWAVLGACTLRQLEEAAICPINGYKDAMDYYTRNSPLPVLHRVSVPTLIVMAEDDPVISVATLPREAVRSNPRLYTAITRRGGHIGWGSSGQGTTPWTDSIATQFLEVFTDRSRL